MAGSTWARGPGVWWGGGGVAGGADAGLAVEGVDFEAAVVGQTDHAGLPGVVPGFEDGVALEGGLVFDRFGDGSALFAEFLGGLGEVGPIDRGRGGVGGEGGADFVELVGVGGGDEDLHGGRGSVIGDQGSVVRDQGGAGWGRWGFVTASGVVRTAGLEACPALTYPSTRKAQRPG